MMMCANDVKAGVGLSTSLFRESVDNGRKETCTPKTTWREARRDALGMSISEAAYTIL